MKVVVIEGDAVEVSEILKRIKALDGQSASAPHSSMPKNDKSVVEEFFRKFRRQNGGL